MYMKKIFTIGFALFAAALFAANSVDEKYAIATASEQKIAESRWLDNIAKHPRLLMTIADEAVIKEGLKSNALLKAYHNTLIDKANDLASVEPPAAKMVVYRLATCYEYRWSIPTLAYAYRITKDKKYLNAAEKYMLKAASFKTWNPGHFLDVSAMTTGIAIGYDWLYYDLPESTLAIVEKAIYEKALIITYDKKHPEYWWRWLSIHNNWNQVCNAGIFMGGLALFDKYPELSKKIILRCLDMNAKSFDLYKPDGAYPEAAGYWEFGTGYEVLLMQSAKTAYGSLLGMEKHGEIFASAKFMQFSTGCSMLAFNYGDCYDSVLKAPQLPQFWFADSLKDNTLLYQYKDYFNDIQSGKIKPKFNLNLPMLMKSIANIDCKNLMQPKQKNYFAKGKQHIFMGRTNWEKGRGIYLAAKGGKASNSHGHMDVGSFVLDFDNNRFVCDPNIVGYAELESRGVKRLFFLTQDSERWSLLCYKDTSHSSFYLKGIQPNVDGFGAMVEKFDSPEKSGAKFDLSELYNAKLKNAARSIYIKNERKVEVLDEFETLANEVEYVFNIPTQAKVKIVSNSLIELSFGNEKVFAKIKSNLPHSAEIFENKITNKKDLPLKGYSFCGFAVKVKPNTKAKVLVQFYKDKGFFKNLLSEYWY